MKPLFRTRITELFGIEHPLICGGLMWLADARYVAAAVNAGGMGFITARTFPEPGAFRAELRACCELTGGRPFGVNLYLSQRPEENAFAPGHIEILVEEGVRFIETSGMPPKDILASLKQAGCTVMHKVASVRHAVSAQRLGVDAVAVVGAECGGHPGPYMIGTIVQALRAAQEVSVPLAVGGGIGQGAQVVAALALGADAVVMGSRMTIAEEIWAHRGYKNRVVEADENATQLVMASFRNTFRVLDNAEARAVVELEASGEQDFEAYRERVAGIRQKEAYETGDWERGILSLGQSAAFANEVKPVAEIFAQILDEAGVALGRVNRCAVTGDAN